MQPQKSRERMVSFANALKPIQQIPKIKRTLVSFANGVKIYDRQPSNHHRGKIND